MIEKLEKILEYAKTKGKNVIGIALGSYLLGLSTGAIGKGIGEDYKYIIPAVLPVMDLTMGKINLYYLIPYVLGISTNYTEEICEMTKNFF